MKDMTKEMIEKEGKVFGCNLLNSFTIFIAEPELIGLVLSKDFTSFPNRRVSLLQFFREDSQITLGKNWTLKPLPSCQVSPIDNTLASSAPRPPPPYPTTDVICE